MRQTRALSVAGSVRTNAFGVRQLVILVVATAALVWGGIAFAQEAYVGHRLGQQVADLKKQNAEIAAQNAGYRKDVSTLQSGTADEEEARLNGYARPSEKLYLVTTASPSPSPVPSPSASPSGHH